MKCPKCGYLGFERVDRCRNCGYDFALTSSAEELELPLRSDDSLRQSSEDLAFLDVSLSSESTPAATPDLGAIASRVADSDGAASELPLFGAPIPPVPDDAPLITRPSPPRPPLAVRRSTPDLPRLRSMQPRSATPATLDLGLEPPSNPIRRTPIAGAAELVRQPLDSGAKEVDAPIGARLAAVVTDLLILAAIDIVVIYFTMEICGLGFADLGLLPRAPLLAFLLVQNGGYLVAFTAGGQTLGKMAAGIKVVAAEPRATLDFGRAFIRELVWLGLAVPAGLGLLTVLSRDHRGVHDRFAGTRVVRA